MKIALVILHADPKRGGAERYTADLAAALAKRGHSVSLLASSFADVPPQVRVVELKAKGLTRARRYLKVLDGLDAHLKSESYDIVHAMLPVRRCDVYHPHAGIASASVSAAPIQAMLNPRRGAMARIERELLESKHSPVLLCLSDYVKAEVARHYPSLPSSKLATLFNAVNLNYFDPAIEHDAAGVRLTYKIASDDAVALIIAQDFPRKGVPQAIEATRRINASRPSGQPKLKLLIVGNGPHSVDDENIIYAGTSWKIAKFYQAADFFVLPTRHDPCSLVVLEALAMGLPVISTIANGACEVMTNGEHGYVLKDANDLDALQSSMSKLLAAPSRKQMSEACLRLRPTLSYEYHLDRLIAIYETCRLESSQAIDG